LPHRALTNDQVLTLLAETPPRIESLTAGLSAAQLHASQNEGEWSANDVLAHLRACADMWGKCIVQIVTQEKPILRAINPRTWIKKTNYPQQKFRSSLRAFNAQRLYLLAFLGPLPDKDWARSATVTGAGKPLERTVRFYAEWLATHERTHVKQIQRITLAMKSSSKRVRS
jgi:hypothetical protein